MKPAIHFTVVYFLCLVLMSGCMDNSFNDQGSVPTTDPETELTGLNENEGNTVFYYYFDEKKFLKEKKELILVCFTDASSRREFINTLPSYSALKVWNPAHSDHWDEDNDYKYFI